MISPPSDHTDDMFASACDTTMDGVDDSTAGGLDGTAMDCIDGNSVWQHMLTCFDPGCPDPLCQGGKAVLKHRLSCQVRLPGLPPLAHNKQIIQQMGGSLSPTQASNSQCLDQHVRRTPPASSAG